MGLALGLPLILAVIAVYGPTQLLAVAPSANASKAASARRLLAPTGVVLALSVAASVANIWLVDSHNIDFAGWSLLLSFAAIGLQGAMVKGGRRARQP